MSTSTEPGAAAPGQSGLLVFDTDVLATLSCAKNDLVLALEAAWAPHLCVPSTIRSELEGVFLYEQVYCAGYIRTRAWVKQALELSDALLAEAETIRRQIAAPSDPPEKHLGEATVLAVVDSSPGWIAVLQDADGRSMARRMGLPFLSVVDLFGSLTERRTASCTQVWAGYEEARKQGRRVPKLAGRADFCTKGCVDHP